MHGETNKRSNILKRYPVLIALFFLVIASIWLSVAPNRYRRHPLYQAIISGNTATVRERLRQHPSELEYRFHGLNATPLHVAAGRGDTNMISLLLSAGAEIEAKGWGNLCTPLHSAALQGHTKAVVFLLEHGARVNALDWDKRTPLHSAAFSDNADTIRSLARHGGNINARAPTHTIPARPPDTPLSVAVELERPNACRALLELGAQADFPYLLKLVENDRSVAPLAPRSRREEWDAIVAILKEFEEKRDAQQSPAGDVPKAAPEAKR